jgi:hypothetical protein
VARPATDVCCACGSQFRRAARPAQLHGRPAGATCPSCSPPAPTPAGALVLDGDRCYFPATAQPRVAVGAAAGAAVYVTRDGWIGVRLDGEGRRIDEYQPCQVIGGVLQRLEIATARELAAVL